MDRNEHEWLSELISMGVTNRLSPSSTSRADIDCVEKIKANTNGDGNYWIAVFNGRVVGKNIDAGKLEESLPSTMRYTAHIDYVPSTNEHL